MEKRRESECKKKRFLEEKGEKIKRR